MDERGQASIEVVAAVPAVVLAGLCCFQLLVAGYTLSLADGAAEAGALALAGGLPPRPAVEAALPSWARERAEIEVEGGELRVQLRPPAAIDAIGDALRVDSVAWVRPPS